MPRYAYIAVDDQGKPTRGRREAASEASLGSLLRREGHWLAEARETRVHFPVTFRRTDGHPVSHRLLESLFVSLGLQLAAGVNVVVAWTHALPTDATAAFRAVHAAVLERVQSGSPLSEAMAAYPRTFSSVVVNLIKAGEASGRLGEVCDDIRRHFEWSGRLQADIRQALVYPTALCLAAGAFFVIVFTFFIPRFSGVLKELGVPLPWLTRALIGLSDLVMSHATLLGLALGLPIAGAIVAFRMSPAFARRIDDLKLRLPVIGPILSQVCLSRLARNLAALYRAGIPLLSALDLCESLVGNRSLRLNLRLVRDGVAAGRPLHETMSRSTLFPPMVVQMTALGESTGTLDQTLLGVAQFYDLVTPRAVKELFTLLEPLMILALLLVVGTIVLSVFLPIAFALGAP